MNRARPRFDERQLEFGAFYSVPVAPPPVPGSLAIGRELRSVLSDELTRVRVERGLGRDAIAERMSELTGTPISVAMLNAYTADSHGAQGHRFPLELMPAFETACDTYDLQRLIASKRGALVLVGEQARDAELGLVRRRMAELKNHERRLMGRRA